MKKIKINNGLFVINENTGRWGLARKNQVSKLETALVEKFPKKREYEKTGLLLVNSSNKCNLDCIYCSEKTHRSYCNKMPLEIGKRCADVACNANYPINYVFHGSEPLLNFGFIKKIVKYTREKGNSDKVYFSIQTNLAKVPTDFFEFMRKYKISVSTSVDGTKKIHDKTRPYCNGLGSYEDIMKNASIVKKIQGEKNFCSVITKHNEDNIEEICNHFETIGVNSVQLIPLHPKAGKHLAPDPIKVGKSYINLFDSSFEKAEKGIPYLNIRNLSQFLNTFVYPTEMDACRICSISSTRHPLIAVDTDGEVYPCELFWNKKEFSMGNIMEDDFRDIIKSKNCLRLRDIDDTGCKDCTWKKLCGEGCLASTHFSDDKCYPYCETNKIVYEYLANKIPELISKDIVSKFLWEYS